MFAFLTNVIIPGAVLELATTAVGGDNEVLFQTPFQTANQTVALDPSKISASADGVRSSKHPNPSTQNSLPAQQAFTLQRNCTSS